MKFLRKLKTSTEGITALEYTLIAALVAIIISSGVSLLGTNVSKVFSSVGSTI